MAKAVRSAPEKERDEEGVPVYKVFQGTVKWLRDARGRLLVQLTTSGEGWIGPTWKMLHQNRMLPETAIAIGEALMWIGEEAIHERDCKPQGITDCKHIGHGKEIRRQVSRDRKRERAGYGEPDDPAA